MECVLWIISAFIVTFMLISLAKLHNEYDKEQANSQKFHPEGRRVLSLQHLSRDKKSSEANQHQMRMGFQFHEGHVPKHKDENLINDMAYIGDSAAKELGYVDIVAIEDNINDFEELDGFNYVKNREKQEADLKLSNNIRLEGNDYAVEDNNQQIKLGGIDKTKPDENILLEKGDFQQDDMEDMPLHEQQLLERNIVQHKPIKPNLPPEDESYDSTLGNSQHNVQLHHYFNTQDNEGTDKKFVGDQIQFYASKVGKTSADFKFMKDKFGLPIKNQQQHMTFNKDISNDEVSFQQNHAEHEGRHQLSGKKEAINYDNFHDSQKLQLPNGDYLKDDKYNTQQQVHHFQQDIATGFEPRQLTDNVQFVDKIIQQQSQYQQTNLESSMTKMPIKRKREHLSKFLNRTESFKHEKQQHHFHNLNNMQSAFPITEKSSVLNVYMKPNGRLGNQMFEIASLYGIARKTGRKPFMSKYSDIYQIFTQANRTVATGESGGDLGILFEEKPGMFSNYLFSLPPTDLVICCYFQSWRYFDGYQSDIRKMFQFRGKIRKIARTIISKATYVFLTQLTDQINQFGNAQTLTYIGVHVRRGDLQQEHHLKRGYRVASLTYFHKAMDYYRQRYPNTIFLVTSDDIEWCKVKLGSSDVFFVEGQHEAVDLAVLSLTNHTVISVGTFSWWAGWLSGGQVIYYKNWLTPNSEVAQQYEHRDYFLQKWKPMGD